MHGRAWLIVAAAALGLGSAASGQELYMMDSNGPTLLLMDGPSGVVIDSMPITGALQLGRGLAMRWDGMLFTTADDRLFRIDPRTGEGKTIGDNLPVGFMTMAADPNTGRLYATSEKDLYRIDHVTGVATRIGTINAPELFAMVFAMAIGRDGVGYVTDMYNQSLCWVDLETAESGFICQPGSQNWYIDMTFDRDGMLWAVLELDGGLRRGDAQTCQRDLFSSGWYIDGLAADLSHGGCYSDCTGDDELDFFDFLCFINEFNVGSPYSDCNGDQVPDLFDFLCFVNSFNAGC
jgi:hypothetical protein